MDIEPWRETATIVGVVISGMVAGLWSGRKAGKREPEGDARVLAASIVPAAEMQALTAASAALREPLERLVDLMEAEAQRRHDEAVVRQALKDRGIVS